MSIYCAAPSLSRKRPVKTAPRAPTSSRAKHCRHARAKHCRHARAKHCRHARRNSSATTTTPLAPTARLQPVLLPPPPRRPPRPPTESPTSTLTRNGRPRHQQAFLGLVCFSFWCDCCLLAYRPSKLLVYLRDGSTQLVYLRDGSTHLVYLRDGSTQTITHAATLRLNFKLSTSPSHSILTPAQLVPVPTL